MSRLRRFLKGFLEPRSRENQEHGLGKVAFHIDTTQKGRRDFPRGIGEGALDPVRDFFADMVRSVRRRTRRRLHAAQTVTLTPENIDQLPQEQSFFESAAASKIRR